MARIVTPIETNLDPRVDAGERFSAMLYTANVEVERFLAQDGLAGERGRGDEFDVRIGGRSDESSVDRFVCKSGFNAVDRLRAIFGGHSLRGQSVDVVHISKRRFRMRSYISRMHDADAARAEQYKIHHG